MDLGNRKSTLKLLEKIFDKKISKMIENSIYEFSESYAETQGTPFLIEQIYQDKADELFCQFNDKSKKKLIKDIKSGVINPETIAQLKPQELNPEKYEKITKKKELEEYNKNNKASTDIFKCSKCGHRKCKVEEKQVRAGDEPATTFVECQECGHQWRIG
tara:strand:- start:122 stop:601 length:480 start_codon:yes stop_codon:yes gene_type:complete